MGNTIAAAYPVGPPSADEMDGEVGAARSCPKGAVSRNGWIPRGARRPRCRDLEDSPLLEYLAIQREGLRVVTCARDGVSQSQVHVSNAADGWEDGVGCVLAPNQSKMAPDILLKSASKSYMFPIALMNSLSSNQSSMMYSPIPLYVLARSLPLGGRAPALPPLADSHLASGKYRASC